MIEQVIHLSCHINTTIMQKLKFMQLEEVTQDAFCGTRQVT